MPSRPHPRSARPASNRHHNGTSTSPSGRARAHGQTPTVPRYRRPRTKRERPLAPDVPPFAEPTTTAPLLVAVPSPAANVTLPPVLDVLRPAPKYAAPPDPLVPLPALTLTAPPRPPDAAPEPIEIPPPFPLLAEPELNASSPLAPDAPPLALATTTAPELFSVPSPAQTAT